MTMTQDPVLSRLKEFFPVLYGAREQLPVSSYNLIEAPARATIFDIGSACEHYLLLTGGKVSVKMLTKNGKSLLLYHVNPGESCIITTSCLLGNSHYPTFGEAETQIEALSIPGLTFNRALDQCSEFRQFVFDGLGQRLADVMQRLELVNFTSIDSRLATSMLAREQPKINITHEALAEEVGTAREVVSRHLKKMETRGMVSLERGVIIIKDREKLENLCE